RSDLELGVLRHAQIAESRTGHQDIADLHLDRDARDVAIARRIDELLETLVGVLDARVAGPAAQAYRIVRDQQVAATLAYVRKVVCARLVGADPTVSGDRVGRGHRHWSAVQAAYGE